MVELFTGVCVMMVECVGDVGPLTLRAVEKIPRRRVATFEVCSGMTWGGRICGGTTKYAGLNFAGEEG